MRVFVDTSAWFAFANGKDPAHKAVRDVLAAHTGRLVTSNYVFDEIVTLCRVRASYAVAVRVGALLQDVRVVELVRITPEDERTAWSIFQDRPDQEYSFTDCTSFASMRRLKLTTAIALDSDFRKEGFTCLP
jgi:predicted nucleic acid-binding protein